MKITKLLHFMLLLGFLTTSIEVFTTKYTKKKDEVHKLAIAKIPNNPCVLCENLCAHCGEEY